MHIRVTVKLKSVYVELDQSEVTVSVHSVLLSVVLKKIIGIGDSRDLWPHNIPTPTRQFQVYIQKAQITTRGDFYIIINHLEQLKVSGP